MSGPVDPTSGTLLVKYLSPAYKNKTTKECSMRVLFFIFIVSFAEEGWSEEGEELILPLREGNWNLALSGTAEYDSQNGLLYRVAPEVQYFFKDRLSAGFTGLIERDRSSETQSIGLIATYYFYELERSAFYLSQSISYVNKKTEILNYNKREDYATSTTTLGYNYFINSSVAVGPRISYDVNSMKTNGQKNALVVGFGLSVFF